MVRLTDPESGEVLKLRCLGNMGAKPDGHTGKVEFNINKYNAKKLFNLKSANDIKKQMKVLVTIISESKGDNYFMPTNSN